MASGLERIMNLFENAFGIHEHALPLRNKRMQMISENIANADTPHFKAKDLDFAKVLDAQRSAPMQATHSEHFRIGALPNADGVFYRTPFNASADGNTVELTVEQARYGKAGGDYQATLSFLENRVSGIRKALRGE
jgi:flagellar basal-body rod protein FlgB